MSYQYNNSKFLDQQDYQHNNTQNSQQMQMQIKVLQEEIEHTIYNYQSLLELEKKNSADRSEFLLFLIQSTRTRQNQELETLKSQLETAVAEKQEAQHLQKQMESIGQGVDSIVQQGKKLKSQNEQLQRQLQQQQQKQRELDDEISSCQRQLQGYRQKIDEWQRIKIKWNRRKKQLLDMINQAQKQIHVGYLQIMQEEDQKQHQQPLQMLYKKYKGGNNNK